MVHSHYHDHETCANTHLISGEMYYAAMCGYLRIPAERRTACRVILAHTCVCVLKTFTFEEHRSAHNSRFGTLKSEQLN